MDVRRIPENFHPNSLRPNKHIPFAHALKPLTIGTMATATAYCYCPPERLEQPVTMLRLYQHNGKRCQSSVGKSFALCAEKERFLRPKTPEQTRTLLPYTMLL